MVCMSCMFWFIDNDKLSISKDISYISQDYFFLTTNQSKNINCLTKSFKHLDTKENKVQLKV